MNNPMKQKIEGGKKKLVNQKLIDEAYFKGLGKYEEMSERMIQEVMRLRDTYPMRGKARVMVEKDGVNYHVSLIEGGCWDTPEGLIIKGRI
jgi:hypothetical protein